MQPTNSFPRIQLQAGRCPVCNKPLTRSPTGRKKRFCCDRCRSEARRVRNFSKMGRCRPEPRKRSKSQSVAGASYIENPGRVSRGIVGPAYVLRAEIGAARTWTEIVSRDGIKSEQTVLRPAVLVERNRGATPRPQTGTQQLLGGIASPSAVSTFTKRGGSHGGVARARSCD
jgi:hypothetical protein